METPVYIYEREKIKENYEKIRKLINGAEICYALKASAEEGILKTLAKAGAWFECASTGEFNAVLEQGVDVNRVIYGLPIKPDETIQYLYDKGCRYFVFEELPELVKIQQNAPEAHKILRLFINDIVANTIEFGMKMDIIRDNENDWLQYVDGISFHISENTDFEIYKRVIARVEEVLEILSVKYKKQYIVNIGGGLHLEASEEFFAEMNGINSDLMNRYDIKLFAEPGEAIVKSTGKILSRVMMIKGGARIEDIYLDIGYSQGIAVRRIPTDISVYGRHVVREKKKIFRFIDSFTGKMLFMKRTDLLIQENDILIFEGCGAYSTVFCNDYLSLDKIEVIYD